jgi:hypothetical protein
VRSGRGSGLLLRFVVPVHEDEEAEEGDNNAANCKAYFHFGILLKIIDLLKIMF